MYNGVVPEKIEAVSKLGEATPQYIAFAHTNNTVFVSDKQPKGSIDHFSIHTTKTTKQHAGGKTTNQFGKIKNKKSHYSAKVCHRAMVHTDNKTVATAIVHRFSEYN